MNRRYSLLLSLAVLLALALAACGGKGTKTAPATATSAAAAQATAPKSATAAKPTSRPAAQPTAAPTAESTETPPAAVTEKSLTLASRDTGLDQLKSYRATWRAQWKATDQGKTDEGAWNWSEEYTSEPRARHLTMKIAGSDATAETDGFEIWQIGDTTYMKSGADQQCLSFSSEGAEKDIEKSGFSPTMLGAIEDAKYVGQDTINGVPAKHYRYNSKSGILLGLDEVIGDTWVAAAGGYVVKDAVTFKGRSGGPTGFLGMGSSSSTGEGNWTWELSDVNAPIAINPPEGCSGSQLDLPIMPDATEKSRFGNMTSYKSASKPADVAAFYQDRLAADGWQAEGEPTDMGETVILNFAKDDLKLNVMISTSDGATQVMLNIGE
jgi:predicted small lipoprotein YifL